MHVSTENTLRRGKRLGRLPLFAVTGLSSLFALPAHGAEDDRGTWYGALTYNMAVPLNSTSDFTGDFSPMGVGFDVRYKLRSDLSLGFAFAWQVIEGETSDVIELENAAFQGRQFRWTNTIPLLVTSHYYFRQLTSWVTPFAGLGLGAYFFERRVDVGVYQVSSSTWHFGLAPEVGFGFRVAGMMPVLIFRYNHAFSSDDSGDQGFMNFNIGIAWD